MKVLGCFSSVEKENKQQDRPYVKAPFCCLQSCFVVSGMSFPPERLPFPSMADLDVTCLSQGEVVPTTNLPWAADI